MVALGWGLAERQGGVGGHQRGLEQWGKLPWSGFPGLTSRGTQQREDLYRRTVGTKGLLRSVFFFYLRTWADSMQVLYLGNLQSHSSDFQGPVYGEKSLKFSNIFNALVQQVGSIFCHF